jgi:hypothetical protein
MVHQTDDGQLIAHRFRSPSQLTLRPHAISHGCFEVARISLLPIRRAVAEAHIIFHRFLQVPKALVKADNATVEMIRPAPGELLVAIW